MVGGNPFATAPPFRPPPIDAPNPRSEDYSWLGGFAASAIGAFPELIGVSPGRIGLDQQAIESWRASHPIAGFASQLIPGLAMPVGGMYVGGAMIGRALLGAAARSMPITEAVVAGVARQVPRIAQSPFTVGVAADALSMVPYEAARIGAAALVGDEGSLGRIAQSAAIDIGIGAAVGGGVNWYRSTRVRDQDALMRGLNPEYSGRASAQERLGQSYEMRAGAQATPDALSIIEPNIARLERDIRMEVPGQGERHVDQLWDGSSTDEMNRLFGTGTSPNLTRRRLTTEAGQYGSRTEWENVAEMAGVPPDWQAHVRFPRVVEAGTPQAYQRVQETLQRNLRTEVDGWRMAREANTQMFVMARELPGEQFLMFRTATPSKFVRNSVFEDTANRSAAYMRKVEAPLERSAMEAMGPNSLLPKVEALQRTVTPEAAEIVARSGSLEQYLNMLPEGMRQIAKNSKEGMELLKDTWNMIKSQIAPGDALWRNAPGAGAQRLIMGGTYDLAGAEAAAIINGRPVVEAGKNLLFRTIRPREGIQTSLRGLTDDEFQHAFRTIAEGGTVESARRSLRHLDNPELEERIMALVEYVAKSNDGVATEIGLLEKALQVGNGFKRIEGYFGMHHGWIGTHRVRVTNDAGKLVGMGAGRTSKEAMENARNIARETGGVVEKRSFISGRGKEDEKYVREIIDGRGERIAGPSEREMVFRGGNLTPVKKSEFYELFDTKIRGEHKYMADTIVDNRLASDITDVRRRYGDRAAEDLEYRRRALAGDKGKLDKVLNSMVGRVLGPWLGPNAGDRLVSAYNKFEYANLVFVSPAYLAQQIVTPIQTVMPAIANLVNGNAGVWQRFMDFVPTFAGGKVSGFRGMLSPMRIMSASMRSLARPSVAEAKLMMRAAGEGKFRPQFIDEFAGQNSKFGQAVGEGFASGSTFAERATNATINTFKYGSTIPAARVEELSRMYAFLAGRHVAVTRGITDEEQVYQVAKRFMDRTMYQYSAADRAKIGNGPAGSAFMLFKNWLFNNINDWSLYGSEAFRHGNLQPLLYAMAGNGALAGLGGMSIFGVADGLSKMFSDHGLMQHIYEAFGNGPDGNNMADALYFGLPGLLGVSLQNQLSAPGADPQQDVNFLWNFVALRRAQKISTLAEYFSNQWQATGNPLASERTWDMFNYAIGPRVLYKLTAEVEDGALRSIRDGRRITEITNESDRWVNALGFQPTRIARAYEASTQLFRDRANTRAMTSRLGEAYARAIEAGDQQAMTFIVRRAIETGADISSVMRSAATRIRLEARPVLRNDFRRDPNSYQLLEALGL